MQPRYALLCLLLLPSTALCQSGAIIPDDWLVLTPIYAGGRVALSASPAYKRYFMPRVQVVPTAGQTAQIGRGRTAAWQQARLVKGALKYRGSAYCYTTITLEQPARMIVETRGCAAFAVNGVLFAGEVYRHGFHRAPVLLNKGVNRLLARGVRGQMNFKLVPATAPIEFNARDVTLPSLRAGLPLDAWAAIPLLNTTGKILRGATLEVGDGTLIEKISLTLPPLAPLALRKQAFRIRTVKGAVLSAKQRVELPLRLIVGDKTHKLTLTQTVLPASAPYRLTFRSDIDDSIQYCGIRPPIDAEPGKPLALILSLHGAGVDALGQASAYSAKSWAVLAAGTNRRRFGFDWEDWGRMDALEVLAAARKAYRVDPDRVYLVGHSMGGHGTWHVGVTHPDQFAALGPSAGWISFWSYGGALRDRSPLGRLLRRSIGGSDTLALKTNYKDLGIFIIHGEADRNVPISQAREMIKQLKPFHQDLAHHFEKGAGHWWNGPRAGGADCVDLPALWDFCRRHVRNPHPTLLDFSSASLSISHQHYWLELRAQQTLHAVSRIQAEARAHRNQFLFKTSNLTRFRFDPKGRAKSGKLQLEIDGAKLTYEWPGGLIEAARSGAGWTVGPPQEPTGKHPRVYGPFKQAFSNRFVMVYGTRGTAEARAAALARARLDAGTWWYRGNGHALLIPDSDYDDKTYSGRNVILYGNESCNAVWKRFAAGWPLRVLAGKITLGEKIFEGQGLACLASLPHPTDRKVLVGLVGGSGPAGIRLSRSALYFLSGTGLPDVTIWDDSVLEKGISAVRLAGYFDQQWGLEKAEMISR